jgi:hypothetical protein
MARSPLEDLVHFLRRRASAQASTETSDVERSGRHRDVSDEEVDERDEAETDTEVEETRRKVAQRKEMKEMPKFRARQRLRPPPRQGWNNELFESLSQSQSQSKFQSQS